MTSLAGFLGESSRRLLLHLEVDWARRMLSYRAVTRGWHFVELSASAPGWGAYSVALTRKG